MSIKTYAGGCQCGAVRYEASLDLNKTVSCNCSRCGRLGSILSFAPTSGFKLIKGEGATTAYRFNKHFIQHLFCATCGIQSYSRGVTPDGAEMIAVNARCLDGVEPDALSPQKYDGRSM